MKRSPISISRNDFPTRFHPYMENAQLYDSSCSPDARVYYIDKGQGFFLKTAPKGALAQEAAMTELYHSLGFAAEVLAYEQADVDWLLTARVPGEDCIHPQYLDDPKHLSTLLGELLRHLHDTPLPSCIRDRTSEYIQTVRQRYQAGNYDTSHFPDNWGYACPEDAWAVVEKVAPKLRSDTLIHGDFCLPNIMLDNWTFSGWIDLGAAGAGDRHMDLFWGAWSLWFNLKDKTWSERFLDAYGRDRIDMDILSSIGAFEVFG